jgi:hypothetical protein
MRPIVGIVSLAACLVLELPLPGVAQQREPVLITGVRVGFPITQADTGLFKAGAWTPVYIDLQAGPQGLKRGEIVVEAADPDDVRNRFTTPLPAMEAAEQATVISYQRPGSPSAEMTVSVLIDGKPVASRQDFYPGLDYSQQLILTVGSRLHHLRQALSTKTAGEEDQPGLRDDGPRRVAVVESIAQLPAVWFGYGPVDLLVLTTGNRDFVIALLNERDGRKEAMMEWVRRGGRLVVSVSRNQDVVAKLDPLAALFPVTITGNKTLNQIFSVRTWRGVNNPPLENALPGNVPGGQRPPLEIASLEPKPNREKQIQLREPDNGPPIIVQGAYGLGRVTVLAVDLDEEPFKSWPGASRRDNFWEKLLEINSLPQPPAETQSQQRNLRFVGQQNNPDLAGQLVVNLEDFEDIPVISFGWVALFILLYILVVGPLDYLFLKKVVKRLELTWITFPAVVIAISVIAYFTAYWLKGNDQKINKIDLLDIDLQTQQIYGNSWFTIFSPRIQNYTIGLEPAAPGWVPATPAASPQNITMSWMARSDPGFGGTGRTGSAGLFRRAYDYTPYARSLLNVPIQVWSTKSFTATWEASFGPAHPPVSSTLHYPEKGQNLSGTITSHLPVDLVDVVLYSAPDKKWYSLDKLLPDLPQRIDAIQAGSQGMLTDTWFGAFPTSQNAAPGTPQGFGAGNPNTFSIIKRLLFTQMDTTGARNLTLAHLDQSWRLARKDADVAFVVGRIARQDGQAEQVAQGSASPTVLWLGSLPDSGQPRMPLAGTLAQEGYVRMILPVGRTPEG